MSGAIPEQDVAPSHVFAIGPVKTWPVADLLARARLDGPETRHHSRQGSPMRLRTVAAIAPPQVAPAVFAVGGALVSVDCGWTAKGTR